MILKYTHCVTEKRHGPTESVETLCHTKRTSLFVRPFEGLV